jgi:hypothetical protein
MTSSAFENRGWTSEQAKNRDGLLRFLALGRPAENSEQTAKTRRPEGPESEPGRRSHLGLAEVHRPSPETVWKIWESVSGGRSMARAELARAVRRETGCARATAYRAVADALAQGVLERA